VAQSRMTVRRLIQLLKKHRPKTPEAYRASIGKLRYIDAGAFRACYRVLNMPLVIKFPLSDDDYDDDDGWHHARQEIKVIRVLLSKAKFRPLRKYVPRIFYADYRRGILVTEHLDQRKISQDVAEVVEAVFSKYVKPDSEYDSCDFDSEDNLGRDAHGQIKVLDFGCISAESS
jgi:hypothetical protein